MSEELKPKIPNTVALVFYSLLLIAGIVLYFGWNFLYNSWADPGIYSIVIVLVSFGIVGVLLYGKK